MTVRSFDRTPDRWNGICNSETVMTESQLRLLMSPSMPFFQMEQVYL